MTDIRPTQTSVHLQLPASLLTQIDQARNDAPRNAWIRRAIQQRLDRETTPRPRAKPNAPMPAQNSRRR